MERHGLAAAGTFSPPDRAISPLPGRRADWHMWIVDVSGDALFPRRYLDEYEKRVFELHRCVERAREHNADAIRQAAGFLLDAADAHEQAAMAYELAGGNGHARAFQARAMRHRQAAAARRAAAAALASGVPKGRVSDDPRPQAAIPDGDPPGLPGEPDAGTDHLGVSRGNGHEQQRDTRSCELPRDITHRAVGPAQAVLPSRSCCSPPQPGGEQPSGCQRPVKPTGARPMGHLAGQHPLLAASTEASPPAAAGHDRHLATHYPTVKDRKTPSVPPSPRLFIG